MENEGVGVYAEAKGEYTRQLCQFLTPSLHTYFLELLELAKEKETDSKRHLLSFQTLLEGISEWNVDKVQRETQAISIRTQCDYLEELLTAVFIAHTKVLSAIRLTNKQKKLQITIPKLEHFLHRTLTECARHLWTNTYLFSTGPSLEMQKNMRHIETLITEGVLQGIRTMLPVKSILREYLSTEESDSDSDEDENKDSNSKVKVLVNTDKKEVENAESAESSESEFEEKEAKLEEKEAKLEEKGPKAEIKTPKNTPVHTPKSTPKATLPAENPIPTLVLDDIPEAASTKMNEIIESEDFDFEDVDVDDIAFEDEKEEPAESMDIEFEEIP
jgi:hypothetical protein